MNASAHTTRKQKWERFLYFFPFQLVLLHFKKNHFLLAFWVILAGMTAGVFGGKYGAYHQVLFPEYLGETNFLSFGIVGFSLGGFILGFNLYSYIMHGFRFPFIATLNRPFIKFGLNNFIIPTLYLILFFTKSFHYQQDQELLSIGQILMNFCGFISGMFLFNFFTWIYFNLTNKNATHLHTKDNEKDTPIKTTLHKKDDWVSLEEHATDWRVETYLSGFFKLKLARECTHYAHETLKKVFSQNHYNASLFEIISILTFIALGSFGDSPYFVIPAGASVILFFTVIMMLISAVFSWVKGWTITILIVVFALLNFSSSSFEFLHVPNYLYGLDYDQPKPKYNSETIKKNRTKALQVQDLKRTIKILDNWKAKVSQGKPEGYKPKLVIINCSGGGSRSALWTMSSLLQADKKLKGKLLNNTFLITGSSGGMVGAGYMRELYLQQQTDTTIHIYDQQYCDNIGKDILNPVLFSMFTNDFFFRYKKFEFKGKTYPQDRGYAFEKQLLVNTHNALDKTLEDYKEDEFEAKIPLMIFSPTITNDGRRLLVASQPISYLSNYAADDQTDSGLIEDVEFQKLFAANHPENTKFTSAMRMNATFPYILPMVTLPSSPELKIMDAGLRDNYGLKTTMEFIFAAKDWINENTRGIVLVQTRDVNYELNRKEESKSLMESVKAPLGGVYGNFNVTQLYNNEQAFRYLSCWLKQCDVVTFQLDQDPNTQLSLSWHLTQAEKHKIRSMVITHEFSLEVEKLEKLLE